MQKIVSTVTRLKFDPWGFTQKTRPINHPCASQRCEMLQQDKRADAAVETVSAYGPIMSSRDAQASSRCTLN